MGSIGEAFSIWAGGGDRSHWRSRYDAQRKFGEPEKCAPSYQCIILPLNEKSRCRNSLTLTFCTVYLTQNPPRRRHFNEMIHFWQQDSGFNGIVKKIGSTSNYMRLRLIVGFSS